MITKEEYEAALSRINVLMDIEPMTLSEEAEFGTLLDFIEAYEETESWG